MGFSSGAHSNEKNEPINSHYITRAKNIFYLSMLESVLKMFTYINTAHAHSHSFILITTQMKICCFINVQGETTQKRKFFCLPFCHHSKQR